MLHELETNIQIEKPIEQVAKFMFQPQNVTKWHKIIKSCQASPEGNFYPGQILYCLNSFLGISFHTEYKILASDCETYFIVETKAPFYLKTTYELFVHDANTTVARISNQYNARTFFKLEEKLFDWMTKLALTDIAHALKEAVERE